MPKQIWKMGILKKNLKTDLEFRDSFRKKKFFREFSRNFEIPENFKTRFSTFWHRDTAIINSSNERAENLLSDAKKFWRGGGGRNRVKFHFEVFWNFWNRKMPGISKISWIIMIFLAEIIRHDRVMNIWFEKIRKKYFMGVKLHKTWKKCRFF